VDDSSVAKMTGTGTGNLVSTEGQASGENSDVSGVVIVVERRTIVTMIASKIE
jgi:hypothetical protein